MKKMNSLLVKGFQPAKCKTQLRLGTSRIKLLRNKKGIQAASDKREVAEFLRNGQENNARLRVEHVIREQNLIEAYDLLYLYAERIAAQLPVIDSQKTCPPDLKEDISTLLFASSRCAELPDFAQIRPMFITKYGKEFVSAAEELRPGCGVNRMVIEKLSVSRASGEAKLKAMKDIAAEHNVQWDPIPFEKEIRVVPDDLLDGPTVFTSAETIDDFPSVPSQKPTLGTHLSQSGDFTNSNSGRFMEDKLEPTNSPRPGDDHWTVSQGAVPRSGPPSRKPPGRDLPRIEDLTFDDSHTDMDPGRRETQSRRNSVGVPQTRHQVEESRRNSIGVSREKSGRAHTGSAYADMDEPLPQEYKKHNGRVSQGAEIDDYEEASKRKDNQEREHDSESDGGHRLDRRQSQKYDQHAVKGQVREAHADPSYTRNSRTARTSQEKLNHTSDEYEEEDFAKTRPGTDGGRRNQIRQEQDPEEVNYSTISRKEGSGKSRKQEQDHDEDYCGGVPSREGSGKARAQHLDQGSDEHNLRKAPSREGSGKGRSYHDDQYDEEDKLRRASSKEGSGSKMYSQETSIEEGSHGRISGRGKEGKQYAVMYRGHDDSSEDADHGPHRSDEPRRRDSTNNKPKYKDEDDHNPEWDNESFSKSVTTRMPRNSEDERRDSGKGTGRDSLNRRIGVSSQADYSAHVLEGDDGVRKKRGTSGDDTLRKSNNLVKRKDNETPHYDSSEYEDDPRGGGAIKPEPRHNNSKATNTRNSDRSSDSGEEGSRQGTRRTPRFPSVDEQKRDTLDDLGPSRGKRGEDLDSLKTSRNSKFDNDEVDFDDDHFTRTEKRMSLPGGSVRDKSRYQGNRASADYDDTGRPSGRRETIDPAELRAGRNRGTEDSPRTRFGEKEKQLDTKRQLPKVDIMEGRHSPNYSSQRDRSDRHRKVDSPGRYDDDRPPRFSNPKVGVQASLNDEYSPNSRVQRDRSDRQRKTDMPRFDDDKPPPRFIKVGKQDDEDVASGRSSPGFRTEKPQRFVNPPRRNDGPLQPTLRPRKDLQSVKTDPDLPNTPKAPAPEHRKTQSASDGQPQPKPAFMKPPDLDVLIQMFGNKKK